MTLKPLIKAGNPILKRRSEEVSTEDIVKPKIQTIIDDLFFTMKHYHGAGLAAPQIGINLRIVTYGFDKNPRYPKAGPVPLTVLVNPEIIEHSYTMTQYFEGCLSVGTLRCVVPRYDKVHYKAYDREGKAFSKMVYDFEAKIIQHEIDHLNGMLFVERIKDFTQFGFTEELREHGHVE